MEPISVTLQVTGVLVFRPSLSLFQALEGRGDGQRSANRIAVAVDQEVELAAAYPQPPCGFGTVSIAPPKGPVQQHAFQGMEIGGHAIRFHGQLEGGIPFWCLPKELPAEHPVVQFQQIARAGEAA